MSIEALDMRGAALLVIDMQNAFVHKEGTLGISGIDTDRLAAIVPTVKALVERFDSAGIPVLWTLQEHFAADASRARKKLAGHTSRRKQVSALAGSWDQQIVDELKPLAEKNPSLIIRKHRFGSFHETRLDIVLKMLGVQTLFIVGTTTNACVETTIREGYLRDLDVVAIEDGISGVRAAWEETAKAVWKQYLAEVSTSAEIFAWIDAQTKPQALGFGHILLMVEDMDRSVAFYNGLLGCTIRPAKPLADGRPFTAFREGIALVGGGTSGHRQVDHLALEVNDVTALRDSLAAAGVSVLRDLHDGPYGKTIYVADPDGTMVELYQV